MLRNPFLRNILLVSILFATLFPLYALFYTIPSYKKLLIHETEHEATRFVRSLVASNNLDQSELNRSGISPALIRVASQLKEEGWLVKLRIFSSRGVIIFSSDKEEVGTVNEKDYFREIVAKGQTYSKMVRKESVTAEGIWTDRDLVETYVPVMLNERFQGAMEVYSDVTDAQQGLNALSQQSFVNLLLASAGLLLMLLMLLFRANNSIRAREEAEIALSRANEELEDRVARRTLELSTANQKLASEITERKKAQLAQKDAFVAISEARDRIDAIITSVADALLVTDSQDKIVLINPAAEALFGVKAESVIGSNLSEVVSDDELLLKISKARNELRGTDAIEFDFDTTLMSDRKIHQVRASRLRDLNSRSKGLILLIHDVTRERQIEQMKIEFVSMAAHELQTPRTMILGYSELMLEKSKEFNPAEQADFLRIINDKSAELSRLIDDILDLSRIENGRGMQLQFNRIEPESLCRDLLTDFEVANPEHRFLLEAVATDLAINGDEARLAQVMENLLGNAIKYSPDGGLIRVVLEQEENWLKISVIDQGIGMTVLEMEHAFERFFRGDASNTAARGTGLGLSISRYIIEAHGGKIDIHSEKGTGTCLEIYLPLQ